MLNISKFISILLFSVFLNLVLISKSHAYLDPGTGSIILQMIAAIIASVLAFSQYLKIKIKKFFNNISRFKRNKNIKKNQ